MPMHGVDIEQTESAFSRGTLACPTSIIVTCAVEEVQTPEALAA
jgi:hypothetical protein